MLPRKKNGDYMSKKEIIEQKINSLGDTDMGKALIACLALSARISLAKTTNKFMIDFSESLGFRNHEDTAYKVFKYLYPQKGGDWKEWDRIYNKRIDNSGWLQWNFEENKRRLPCK